MRRNAFTLSLSLPAHPISRLLARLCSPSLFLLSLSLSFSSPTGGLLEFKTLCNYNTESIATHFGTSFAYPGHWGIQWVPSRREWGSQVRPGLIRAHSILIYFRN